MKTEKRPMWISSKDIEVITERSPRHSRRLLERIRRKLKKEKYQPVSIPEFAQFMGITLEYIYQKLGPL